MTILILSIDLKMEIANSQMLDSLIESWAEISLIGSSMKPNFDKTTVDPCSIETFSVLKD